MPNGNGNDSDSGSPEIPDLNKPPATTDGPGGGPATPFGPSMSDEEKEGLTEFAEVYDDAAVAAGAAGASAAASAGAGSGVTLVGAVFFAELAAGFALASWILTQLAGDPPQPYDRIVKITPRVRPVPATSDPIQRSLGIVAQQNLFTLVTAQCYLTAIERLAGAQQAHDLSWTVTHYGVVRQCRRTLAVNFGSQAAALYAAAKSLRGSPFDSPLTQGSGEIGNWLNSLSVEQVTAQLANSGLTAEEIQQGIQLLKAKPSYMGPHSTVSAALERSAEKLYIYALRLDRIWRRSDPHT